MRPALRVAIAVVGWQVAAAVFERVAPYRVIKWYWKVANPPWKVVAGRVPGFVLLETTGRRTGRKHQVPVGARLQEGSVWVVTAHASEVDYIKNIKADPAVRVQVIGRWRNGVARIVPDDDAPRRAIRLNLLNGLFMRVASADLVTVRIDLE